MMAKKFGRVQKYRDKERERCESVHWNTMHLLMGVWGCFYVLIGKVSPANTWLGQSMLVFGLLLGERHVTEQKQQAILKGFDKNTDGKGGEGK